MAKVTATCHICMDTFYSKTVLDSCPRCCANLADPSRETIAKKATRCLYSISKKPYGDLGDLLLTNKRLLWVNRSDETDYGTSVVEGQLADALATIRQPWGFSLPLTEIKSLEASHFGLLKTKTLIVTAKDDSIMMLTAKPRDEWIEAIKKAQEQFVGQ